MHIRPFLLTPFLALTLIAHAQAPDPTAPALPPPTPGGIATPPRTAEPALEALTRTSPDTLTLTLAPGKSLLLHDFDFNGDPVPTDKIHLRQLGPGIFELTSLAYAPGFWRFHLTDQASIFGLGEHFDTLDHAHTLLHLIPLDVPSPRGSTSLRPVPFFLSTTGFALYLDLPPDPTGQAPATDSTFNLNATEPGEIILDAATTRLRVLLFTGPPATPGRFPNLLADFLATASPSASAPSAHPAPLAQALTAALSASLSGLPPAPIQLSTTPSATPPDAPPTRYVELAAFTATALPCPAPGVDPALCTRYKTLFQALQPYRDAAAKAVHQPLLRPLALDFQDDPQVRVLTDEYLLGPDLLVAPILDTNTSRPVYLPAGVWRNLATGEQITGPRTILVPAPLDTIPLFARPDATLPRELTPPAPTPPAPPA